MYKSKQEVRKTFVDHMESVKDSGFGHENAKAEILGAMLNASKEFDQGCVTIPFGEYQRLLSIQNAHLEY